MALVSKRYLLVYRFIAFMFLLFIAGCTSMKKNTRPKNHPIVFYNAGHRGARGLMPENTIPAMEKGMEVGANTLETDLQVTKDGKIVLNHDCTFNPYYVTTQDGTDIPEIPDGKRANNSYIPVPYQDEYAIYKLNYDYIRKFIAGEKFYAAFPEQQRVKTYMPLFTEMIDSVEAFTKKNHYLPVYYMPEIKSDPKYYGKFQPNAEDFVSILMNTLKPYLPKIGERLIIQCADMEPLRILHRDYPAIQLALLPRKKGLPIGDWIKELGFKPDFFLPRYSYVTSELLKSCHSLQIKVIPWTPDDSKEMRKLVNMGVDGIITNYPNRLTNILKNLKKY